MERMLHRQQDNEQECSAIALGADIIRKIKLKYKFNGWKQVVVQIKKQKIFTVSIQSEESVHRVMEAL